MYKFRTVFAVLPLFMASVTLAQQPPAPVVQIAYVSETEVTHRRRSGHNLQPQ